MSTTTILFVDDILTSKQCADLLGIGHNTLLNKISLKQDTPKGYKIPNTRGFRYVKSEVIEWLKNQPSTDPKPKKKRGRPRKAQ